MLLGGEDLNDTNMLAHLGIIEQRSNELLQVWALERPQSDMACREGTSLCKTLTCSIFVSSDALVIKCMAWGFATGLLGGSSPKCGMAVNSSTLHTVQCTAGGLPTC